MRAIASPRSGLVISSDSVLPSDWPVGESTPEANLGHALGWTCEVRRNDIVVLNPLGEGIVKAALPSLSVEWLTTVRHDGSCAIYLTAKTAEAGFAELTIAAAASSNELRAATVRTAVADDHGKTDPVGRNQPCPCGSGKKYKHCHG